MNPPQERAIALHPKVSGKKKAMKIAKAPVEEAEINLFPDTPFAADELSTLDKFESMNRTAAEEEALIDRLTAESKTQRKTKVTAPRKKSKRRRQIDPATCERDYSQDEVEFMNALNEYKRNSGRMFPTCSEILEVLKTLGYEKQTDFDVRQGTM